MLLPSNNIKRKKGGKIVDNKETKQRNRRTYRFIIAIIILTSALVISAITGENIAFLMALLILIAHEVKRHT